MKSFSSAYRGTPKNDFAKSKQLQGKLDVSLAVLNDISSVQSRTYAPTIYFYIILLAVEQVYRQPEDLSSQT